MPTYRKLHTKVTQSFDFNEMPDDFTRVLWLLLPLGLDCEGRGIYNASWIKAKLMPLREDVTGQQINGAMEWLANRKMVIPYTVDGRTYFYVPTFKQYQSGTEKEAKSVLPTPPSTQELVESKSGVNQEEVGMAASASASVNASVNASVEIQETRPNIYAVYEQEIGVLTPSISNKLELAEKEYPPGWVEDALKEASRNNKRSWAYAEAILKRKKSDGLTDKPKKPAGPTPGTPILITLSDGRTVEATA